MEIVRHTEVGYKDQELSGVSSSTSRWKHPEDCERVWRCQTQPILLKYLCHLPISREESVWQLYEQAYCFTDESFSVAFNVKGSIAPKMEAASSYETSVNIYQVTFHQWSLAWVTLISGDMRKHVTSINVKHRNRLNFKPALVLALTQFRPRIEVLACQKQVQSSH
jgi:hypothetical protein